MTFNERPDCFGRGWLSNGVRDIDREEVRVRKKTIHGLKPDMIGIDMPTAESSGRMTEKRRQ